MRRITFGFRAGVLATILALAMGMVPAAAKGPQNDAGSGRDAGNTFEEATKIAPKGYYEGSLSGAGGDAHDFYKFRLAEGDSVSVLIDSPAASTDPITMLDPDGNVVDVGAKVMGPGVTVSAAFTSEIGAVRLAVHRALVAGDYRLHIPSEQYEFGDY